MFYVFDPNHAMPIIGPVNYLETVTCVVVIGPSKSWYVMLPC